MPKARQPFWRDFASKAKLTEAIKAIVNPPTFGVEFESDLLSDLIAERHWHCSRQGLRPTKFKKSPGWKGGYDFHGWFEPKGWHKVSWRECITPDDVDDILKQALRTAIQPIIATYKARHPTCERCQVQPTEDVDHIEPAFERMYKISVASIDDAEKERIMLAQDWDDRSEYQLPSGHPAVQTMLRLHENARMQAVCKECHGKNERERKPK